jgi:hypothetical protein
MHGFWICLYLVIWIYYVLDLDFGFKTCTKTCPKVAKTSLKLVQNPN